MRTHHNAVTQLELKEGVKSYAELFAFGSPLIRRPSLDPSIRTPHTLPPAYAYHVSSTSTGSSLSHFPSRAPRIIRTHHLVQPAGFRSELPLKMNEDNIDEFVTSVRMGLDSVKNQIRAPRGLSERIGACGQNREGNIAQLLKRSLRAWFLVVAVFDDDEALLNLIRPFNRSDIGVLAQRLENLLLSDKDISEYFQHAFHRSQRAKKRQNALVNSGFSSSIPSSIRLSKRPRPEELSFSILEPPRSILRVESPSSRTSSDSASIPPGEPLQSEVGGVVVTRPSETHTVPQPAPGDFRNHRWPKASALPNLFPQRMCDGILRDDRFARITSSYPRDGAPCSLDIDLTKEMTVFLAREIYNVLIRYDGETARWVIEFKNGTDAWVEGYLVMERAYEPSIRPFLGNMVYSAIADSSQRLQELDRGNDLTRLMVLSISADAGPAGQLKVLVDEEMLDELTRLLWLPSTTSH